MAKVDSKRAAGAGAAGESAPVEETRSKKGAATAAAEQGVAPAASTAQKTARPGSTKIQGDLMAARLQAMMDAKEKEAAATGRGGAGKSPTGVTYATTPEMSASDEKKKVFTKGPDGKPTLDGAKVLKDFTQIDNQKGGFDPDRCGGQAAVAAAIMSKDPQKALGKLADAAINGPYARGDDIDKVEAIKKKIDNGTATYADLSKLADYAYRAYASGELSPKIVTDPQTGEKKMLGGMRDDDVKQLFTDAGLKDGNNRPVRIDTDGDGDGDHWVLKGKDKSGKDYYYDPYPMEGAADDSQVFYEGTPEYAAYEKAAPASVRDDAGTGL